MVIKCEMEVYSTVEVVSGKTRSYCEVGLNCEKECKFAYTKDEERQAKDAFLHDPYIEEWLRKQK